MNMSEEAAALLRLVLTQWEDMDESSVIRCAAAVARIGGHTQIEAACLAEAAQYHRPIVPGYDDIGDRTPGDYIPGVSGYPVAYVMECDRLSRWARQADGKSRKAYKAAADRARQVLAAMNEKVTA